MFYVIHVTPACNALCMYLTHVSIVSYCNVNTHCFSHLLCIYCANTYLCRAIARALANIFVIFYIHDSKLNVMLCYVMLMPKKAQISNG